MDVLAVMRTALFEECGAEPDSVQPHVHLLDDLGIDSLDLLNASFRIETDCGVALPFREWLTLEYGDVAVSPSPFLVGEICRYVEAHMTSGAPRSNTAAPLTPVSPSAPSERAAEQ